MLLRTHVEIGLRGLLLLLSLPSAHTGWTGLDAYRKSLSGCMDSFRGLPQDHGSSEGTRLLCALEQVRA